MGESRAQAFHMARAFMCGQVNYHTSRHTGSNNRLCVSAHEVGSPFMVSTVLFPLSILYYGIKANFSSHRWAETEVLLHNSHISTIDNAT